MRRLGRRGGGAGGEGCVRCCTSLRGGKKVNDGWGEAVKETSLGTLRERRECLVRTRRRGSLGPS